MLFVAARKNPHAVALGRKGGQARARNLSATRLRNDAKDASDAAKLWRQNNPELASAIAVKAAKASALKRRRK